MLLAAASLGATVVGSDIDGDCLGYPTPRASTGPGASTSPSPILGASPSLGDINGSSDEAVAMTASPSPVALLKKNNAFQRFGVFNYSQENKTTVRTPLPIIIPPLPPFPPPYYYCYYPPPTTIISSLLFAPLHII